jgi:hypothetical protein
MSNEFSVVEHADIVYLYEYCDGNGLQASGQYRRRFPARCFIAWPPRSPDLNPSDFFFGAS